MEAWKKDRAYQRNRWSILKRCKHTLLYLDITSAISPARNEVKSAGRRRPSPSFQASSQICSAAQSSQAFLAQPNTTSTTKDLQRHVPLRHLGRRKRARGIYNTSRHKNTNWLGDGVQPAHRSLLRPRRPLGHAPACVHQLCMSLLAFGCCLL
jgi:hypothetical protein